MGRDVMMQAVGDLWWFWQNLEVTLALGTLVALAVILIRWYDRRHPVIRGR